MSDNLWGDSSPYLDPNEYSYESTPNDVPLTGMSESNPPQGNSYWGWIQKLMGGDRGADLSKVLGSFSQGEKANRVVKGDFTQGYDRLKLAAQTGRNQNESDALDKLRQTSYIMGGGANYTGPGTVHLNGKDVQLQDYGIQPHNPSQAEKDGAALLQAQLKARLGPNGSYQPQDLGSYATPGLAENLSSYTGAGVGAISALMGGNGATPQGSAPAAQTLGSVGGTAGTALSLAKMAGLGSKAGVLGTDGWGAAGSAAANMTGRYLIPGVGAAMGIYGLAQNNGGLSNVMSGAGTGASIGTMVAPGIGTAVGAGIGAAYGGLQNWLTVTKKEKQGREVHETGIDQLGQGATPDEIAGAQEAVKTGGWKDPRQALGLIVVRDALIKSGMDPQQAMKRSDELLGDLYSAEKKGPDKVTQAYSPIAAIMNGTGR
jgi:hypothetical protein